MAGQEENKKILANDHQALNSIYNYSAANQQSGQQPQIYIPPYAHSYSTYGAAAPSYPHNAGIQYSNVDYSNQHYQPMSNFNINVDQGASENIQTVQHHQQQFVAYSGNIDMNYYSQYIHQNNYQQVSVPPPPPPLPTVPSLSASADNKPKTNYPYSNLEFKPEESEIPPGLSESPPGVSDGVAMQKREELKIPGLDVISESMTKTNVMGNKDNDIFPPLPLTEKDQDTVPKLIQPDIDWNTQRYQQQQQLNMMQGYQQQQQYQNIVMRPQMSTTYHNYLSGMTKPGQNEENLVNVTEHSQQTNFAYVNSNQMRPTLEIPHNTSTCYHSLSTPMSYMSLQQPGSNQRPPVQLPMTKAVRPMKLHSLGQASVGFMIKRNVPRPQKTQIALSQPGQITITRPSFIPGPMAQNKSNIQEQAPTIVQQLDISAAQEQRNTKPFSKYKQGVVYQRGLWSQSSEMVAHRFKQAEQTLKKTVNLADSPMTTSGETGGHDIGKADRGYTKKSVLENTSILPRKHIRSLSTSSSETYSSHSDIPTKKQKKKEKRHIAKSAQQRYFSMKREDSVSSETSTDFLINGPTQWLRLCEKFPWPSPPQTYEEPLQGTCQKLDKKYFRLGVDPKPEDIRPEEVLAEAIREMIKIIRQKERDYFYTGDRLKAMRQDCRVQQIRSLVSLRIYETSARASLEYGDMFEYNLCRSVLLEIYRSGIAGSKEEFLAYQILYHILYLKKGEGVFIKDTRDRMYDSKSPCVHALEVLDALASSDILKFYDLYISAPNLGRCIMDAMLESVRWRVFKNTYFSFRMSIPILYMSKVLFFWSERSLEETGAESLDGCSEGFIPGRARATRDSREAAEACIEWIELHGGVITRSEDVLRSRFHPDKSDPVIPKDPEAVAHGDKNLTFMHFLA